MRQRALRPARSAGGLPQTGVRARSILRPRLSGSSKPGTDGPNRKWVADVTYIWTTEGWLWVAVVIDLFSRVIVDWSCSDAMTSQLATDARIMAIWRRGRPQAGTVRNLVCEACSRHWLTNLSPSMTANWVLASVPSRGAFPVLRRVIGDRISQLGGSVVTRERAARPHRPAQLRVQRLDCVGRVGDPAKFIEWRIRCTMQVWTTVSENAVSGNTVSGNTALIASGKPVNPCIARQAICKADLPRGDDGDEAVAQARVP